MRALLQRVTSARVLIDKQVVASIDYGLLVFVAVMSGDTQEKASWLAKKIVNHRIFEGDGYPMNRSVVDVGGQILIVSQFTLAAEAKKGNRPNFSKAEHPDTAKVIYDGFVAEVTRLVDHVQEGLFGADMQVELVNDGPVTILLESS